MSIKSYRFDGGKNLRLQEQPTGAGEQKQQKAELKAKTAENLRKAALLAEKLYAAGTEGLVIAIQARDAAGKDSLVKHVFSALNPQTMEVHALQDPHQPGAEPRLSVAHWSRRCRPGGRWAS